jgi:hypothetical protein
VLATLAFASGPSALAGASSVVTTADAFEFRTTFGFDADAETIATTLADGSADTSYGVPLTVAEASNMADRQRLQTLAEPVGSFVDEHPESFGGLYFTQDTGRLEAYVVTVASTGNADLDEIKRLVPSGLPLSFVQGDYSMAELRSAQDKIDSV